MSQQPWNRDDEPRNPPPSRAEIESLCIVHAIGADGCRVGELAARLGLSEALGSAVAGATTALVEAGWLELEGDRLLATEVARERLKERLTEAGSS